MLNGSVQAKCSARVWVMSGPPPERQSTGDLGCAALEVDGARDQWMSLAAEMGPSCKGVAWAFNVMW